MDSPANRQSDRKTTPAIPDTPTPAIARGSIVLDFIASCSKPVSVQEISAGLGLPKSSVHNVCTTLVSLELLARRSDQTFVLGPHVMRWARAFTRRADVTAEFAQVVDEAAAIENAAMTLALSEGEEIMLIAARNAGSVAGGAFRIGLRLPIAFSAMGKAFLSHLSDTQIERLYENGLPGPRTASSVQSLEKLIVQVRRCRIEGYATSDQECFEGVVSYASTVLDASNQPVAAIALSIPSEDRGMEAKEEVITYVRLAAQKISSRLGADLGE